MTPDRLKDLLGEIPTPQAAQAREQAVAEARAEIAARGETAARGRRPRVLAERPRALSFAAAALLVLVILLTPPGRAASAWVGELVGIGDVGGPPTQEQRGFADNKAAVVIDNGVGPDGNRYEWVAYECKVDLHDEGLDTSFEGIGISFEWPGVKGYEGGGHCEEAAGRPQPGTFGSHGVQILPSEREGVAEPTLMVSGTTGPEVHKVSVIYRDGEGKEHELPVDFARVEGKLREIARRPEALGTFVAFVPGEWAARDEIESRLDLRALMGTGKLKLGPIGRREREQAKQAFETCAPFEPDPASLPQNGDRKALERAFRPLRACQEREMPPSPFEYVAYDENGNELERIGEPLIAAAVRPPATIVAEGREEPGDKRAPRPSQGDGDATVLLTGRSPDGALYEFHVQPTKHGSCMTLWWPYVLGAGGSGSCGPGIPPERAFGRRNPEDVFAKPFGFVDEAPQATTHRHLSGFARPNVSRVRVVYRDRDDEQHDAPVKLVPVSGSKLEAIEASEPFGYWIAFLPRSAGRRPPIEVIAYGEDGEQLGRYEHRE
jgi:hypothetical protein